MTQIIKWPHSIVYRNSTCLPHIDRGFTHDLGTLLGLFWYYSAGVRKHKVTVGKCFMCLYIKEATSFYNLNVVFNKICTKMGNTDSFIPLKCGSHFCYQCCCVNRHGQLFEKNGRGKHMSMNLLLTLVNLLKCSQDQILGKWLFKPVNPINSYTSTHMQRYALYKFQLTSKIAMSKLLHHPNKTV